MIAPLNKASAAVANAPRVLPAADSPSEITAGLETIQALGGLCFERMVERLPRLGARPLAELLIEIAVLTGRPHIVANRVEAYSQLSADLIRALGADQFPPVPLEVVR